MNRILMFSAVALVLAATAVFSFGDIPRPTPSPHKFLHSGLTIAVDQKKEWSVARLQISEATLGRLNSIAGTVSNDGAMSQGITQSSTKTVMAGLFMFLAVSFAGVWLVRTSQKRSQKAIAAAIIAVAVLSAA